MKKDEEFNFVIAKPWNVDDPDSLSIYAYGVEVQRGTMEAAINFREYVRRQTPMERYKDFEIYIVKYEKISEK